MSRTPSAAAMSSRILVVDDDDALRRALERALRLEGYAVDTAADGAEAVDRLAAVPADLVVLDVLMPVLDGLAVCRHLREQGDRTPVLLLTARDALSDRVLGLDTGADDYLTKPFELDELLARVRALLRRSTGGGDTLRYEDLELDPRTYRAHRGERLIELTRTEFRLLELLLRNAEIVLPRETVQERVWGYDSAFASNTLDVYIGYLRRKTEAGDETRLIHTVRGVGFVLRSS